MNDLSAAPAVAPAPSRVPAVVVNLVVGLAELSGLVVWALLAFVFGALSRSDGRADPEGFAAVVAAVGLIPFGLAVVCAGVGVWQGARSGRRAGLLWALAAFLLGLIPWGVAILVVGRRG